MFSLKILKLELNIFRVLNLCTLCKPEATQLSHFTSFTSRNHLLTYETFLTFWFHISSCLGRHAWAKKQSSRSNFQVRKWNLKKNRSVLWLDGVWQKLDMRTSICDRRKFLSSAQKSVRNCGKISFPPKSSVQVDTTQRRESVRCVEISANWFLKYKWSKHLRNRMNT